ncbi:MAG TPA: HAMP domain-containing sensor histidine kinase [Longimicrobium sp.]|nr:HAMP domain-containing sensor histidine kinase [Longimicrobium sp.]
MSLSRRSSRLAPGSAFQIGLLLLMLGLIGVLMYQALAAARAETRSANRFLRGFSELALEELSRRGDQVLTDRVIVAAMEGRRALEVAEARGGEGRALAEYVAAVRAALAWCGCPEAVRSAFRADPAGERGHTVTGLNLRRDHRAVLDSFNWHSARGLVQARARGADTVLVQPVRWGEDREFLVYQVVPAEDGGVRSYGVVVDWRRIAVASLREVLDGEPLLPHTVGSGLSNRQAVAVVVTAPDGEEIYRYPAVSRDAAWVDAKVGAMGVEAVPRGAVSDTLGGLLAPLTARVSVRPDLAAGRPAKGAPESRQPLLLVVVGLTVVLFCVAGVQLRRQQELVRLRDDFVSGVSHELRTPLAQIRLFADLLESGRLGDPAQRARSVRIINEESRRLTYLVENILHFSRAQRDANRLSPQPVEVGKLVVSVVDSFAPLAKDVELATRVEPGVVARIDQDAFRQVLLNLLDNAAKYGPRGQTVQVGMAVVGFAVRVWVRDHGPGVPREERARIWEPYRRLDRPADASVGGSGIGLAVVKDMVELHGGRVWVEDAPGGGARFVAEFPGATYAGPPGDEEPAVAAPVEAAAP